MTTTFTASNGDTIETRPNGDLVVKSGHDTEWLSPFAVDALHEYLQHQRDEELVRWRSKEHPNYVVYPQGPDAIEILCETDGRSHTCGRDCPHSRWMLSYKWAEVQDEYFAAHPEKKPWHDAQSGELWILTIDGEQVGALAWRPAPGPTFETATGTLRHDDPDITAGRRIWPTGDRR